MDSLFSFGNVWMASSPFTDNFRHAKKAIDAGIDAL